MIVFLNLSAVEKIQIFPRFDNFQKVVKSHVKSLVFIKILIDRLYHCFFGFFSGTVKTIYARNGGVF